MELNTNIRTGKVRDDRGLRIGVDYIFTEDGSGVNYKAMLKPHHLYFNRQKAKDISAKYGKNFEDLRPADFTMDQLDDSDLILSLAGVRYLAWLRGHKKVLPKVNASFEGHCSVTTNILWIGNFETDFVEEEFGDSGLATFKNTFSYACNYLDSIATNRAYVRAVRNYLNVNIVATDEIGPVWTPPKEEPVKNTHITPADVLMGRLEDKKLTFEKFVEGFAKKYAKVTALEGDYKSWKSPKDVSTNDAYTLIQLLDNSK